MNKTREFKHSTGTAEEADKKEKYRRTRKFGALILSVIAAVGIGHKLGEPALDDKQLNEATSIAAEAVSDKMGEFEGENSTYTYSNEDGSSSSYRNSQGDSMDLLAYSRAESLPNPLTGEVEAPGTYVMITVNDRNNEKSDEYDKGRVTETDFIFKSDNPQDIDSLVDGGELTIDEVKDFIKSDGVSVSEISSLEDANEDKKLDWETIDYSAYNGGDDHWKFSVNKEDGASGYEDSDEIGNVFTGDNAVREMQNVIDNVESNWGKSK